MTDKSFPIEILSEQRELMEDEILGSEGKEREELEQRLAETVTALSVLRNYKTKIEWQTIK